MGLQLVSPPASEPVTLDEAKGQCRVDLSFTDDDALLTTYIAAARCAAEKLAGLGIVSQGWKLTLPEFPYFGGYGGAGGAARTWYPETTPRQQYAYWIDLPIGPVRSIDSITYLDPSGATQTLDPSTYVWEHAELYDRISLAYGKFWPATLYQADAVAVKFTVGFVQDVSVNPLVAVVPAEIKAAILIAIADLYRQREAQIVGGSVAENATFTNLMNAFRRSIAA